MKNEKHNKKPPGVAGGGAAEGLLFWIIEDERHHEIIACFMDNCRIKMVAVCNKTRTMRTDVGIRPYGCNFSLLTGATMKKIPILILAAALLTGCAAKGTSLMREPDDLEMIRTVGVDKSDDGYTVTIATGRGIDGSPPRVRSGDGLTIDSALDFLQRTSHGQEPFYSHTEHVIIGEELAREGVDEVLDFMARSSEMRIETAMILAKSATAEELMTSSSGETAGLYDILNVMEEETASMGRGYMFTCLDAAAGLRETGHALILAAEVLPGDNALDDSEKTLRGEGFGVIENGKLTGYVPTDDAPGVLLLLNKPVSLNLACDTGSGRVGVTLEKARSDVKPEFAGGDLKKLEVSVSADIVITEAGAIKDLTSEKMRESIEKAVSQQVFDLLNTTISRSQAAGLDYIGLGAMVEKRAPVKFRDLRERWPELFPKLPVELKITTTVRRSYDLEESLTK